MRTLLKDHSFSRWLIPVTITLFLLVLLGHKSSVPQFFSRYSYKFFFLLLAMGMWAMINWTITLDSDRYRRFSIRIRRLPLFSFTILAIGTLMVLNFFLDYPITGIVRLAPMSSLLPVIPITLTIVTWLLSSVNPGEYIRQTIYVILIILICAGTLEVSMIILDPWLFKGFYQYDPDLGFRVRPFANGANRFGFNDQDYPLHKRPNTFRILVLGDSFSWAGGREKNYTALLENKFEEYYGEHRVDVINAGYAMTHTGEQLALLKKYGLQYNPDLVILGFFAGNDFIDADPNRKRIVVNTVYFDIDKRHELVILGYPIVPTLRLIHFFKQKYIILKERMKARLDNPDTHERHGTMSEDKFLKVEKARLEFCNLNLHQTGYFNKQISYIFQSISEMKELLETRKIGLIVAIYPDEFQVSEGLLEKLFETYNLRSQDYDVRLMQKVLSEFLDSKGIPYIDLLDEFRTKGSNGELYILRDTHWNDEGIELAASVMFSQSLRMANSFL